MSAVGNAIKALNTFYETKIAPNASALKTGAVGVTFGGAAGFSLVEYSNFVGRKMDFSDATVKLSLVTTSFFMLVSGKILHDQVSSKGIHLADDTRSFLKGLTYGSLAGITVATIVISRNGFGIRELHSAFGSLAVPMIIQSFVNSK